MRKNSNYPVSKLVIGLGFIGMSVLINTGIANRIHRYERVNQYWYS